MQRGPRRREGGAVNGARATVTSACVMAGTLLLLSAATFLLSAATSGAAGARPTVTRSYYLALGDSVPVWDGSHSYAHLLENHYLSSLPGLVLKDMAVSEATTTSMLDTGQYMSALAFLTKHAGHIALITIDNGGNDLLPCASATGIDPTCLTNTLATVNSNMTTMLDGLHAAAPSVPIIGMSYYDPFLGDWLAGGATQGLALETLPVVASLNDELTTLYGGPSQTADVSDLFKTTNDTSLVESRWGKVPVDVARACTWLDITCHQGAPEGFGDDPNIRGQEKIASTFEHTIGRLHHPA